MYLLTSFSILRDEKNMLWKIKPAAFYFVELFLDGGLG